MKRLTKMVRGLVGKSSQSGARGKVRPALETLERRDTPAGGFTLSTDGVLTITGTTAFETVTVNVDTRGTISTSDDRLVASMTHLGHTDTFTPLLREVSKVKFYGLAGNDHFENNTSKVTWADGGDGNDTLFGGRGNDTMYGGKGDDQLFGWDGHDRLYGNSGLDRLNGENGNDYMDGGYDGKKDILRGGAGLDEFHRHKYFSWFSWKTEADDMDMSASDGDFTTSEKHLF
jgi:hypothetical protein